jgi:hypothetical protein
MQMKTPAVIEAQEGDFLLQSAQNLFSSFFNSFSKSTICFESSSDIKNYIENYMFF